MTLLKFIIICCAVFSPINYENEPSGGGDAPSGDVYLDSLESIQDSIDDMASDVSAIKTAVQNSNFNEEVLQEQIDTVNESLDVFNIIFTSIENYVSVIFLIVLLSWLFNIFNSWVRGV